MLALLARIIGKQKKGDFRFGALVDIVAYTAFWLGLVNFLFNSLVVYSITIKPWIITRLPWFNIFAWFGLLTGIVIITMILEYKIIYPARQTFRNQQEYAHESPIRKDLQKIKDKLGISDEEEEEKQHVTN